MGGKRHPEGRLFTNQDKIWKQRRGRGKVPKGGDEESRKLDAVSQSSVIFLLEQKKARNRVPDTVSLLQMVF